MLAEIFFECRCNFRCWHCSSAEYTTKQRAQSLTLGQLKGIARQLRSVGVLSICYVGGEPTIHPELPKIIRMTNDLGILPSIITNASLLTEAKVDELFDSGLANLGFSMQSAKPELHDRLVNHPGAHAAMLRMIDYCLARGYTASICVVPTNENLADNDFEAMVRFATQRDLRLNVNLPAPVGKLIDDQECALSQESMRLLEQRYFPLENFLPDFKQTTIQRRIHCPMGENTIYILPDGEVCPCTFTHISFGNILKEPIRTILQRLDASPTLQNLIRDGRCPISMDPEFIAKVHASIRASSEYPPCAETVRF
ncbi:MAG: radical SAM protein [Deltaproteobacteria bacterium]|nr:radical SAM protein [Deltaproteobacteria bacterium]